MSILNTTKRPQVASFTSTYWVPGPNYERIDSTIPITGNLGFLFDLPRKQPIAGPWYYGEGRNDIAGDRRLIFRPDPEYYAVDNIIPTINGKPMVDINDPAYTFDRTKFTVNI